MLWHIKMQPEHAQEWHRDGNVCIYDDADRLHKAGPLYRNGRHYKIGSAVYMFPHWRDQEKRLVAPHLSAMRVPASQPCTDKYYLLSADF